MRVAHISEDSRGGGQLQYIQDIVSDSKLDQVIICPTPIRSLRRQWEATRIKSIPINLRILNFQNFLPYLLFFIPELISLKRLISTQKFDIIVGHGAIQIKAIIIARWMGIPGIWIMHDSFLPKTSRFIFRLIHRLSKNYVFVSKRSQTYYHKEFPNLSFKRQEIIPSCVNLTKLQVTDSQVFDADVYNVITTCYINRWKGLELTIDIAHECQINGISDIHFHIVGPILKSREKYAATLTDRISQLNLSNITLHGYRCDIADYLSAADLYLCTSIYESSPISVWEAMAMKLAIVSFDVGDLADIIGHYRCGTVLKERIPKQFLESILTYKNSKALSNQAGENAQRAAFKLFDPSKFTKRHEDFYKSVIDTCYENRTDQ